MNQKFTGDICFSERQLEKLTIMSKIDIIFIYLIIVFYLALDKKSLLKSTKMEKSYIYIRA